MNDTPNDRAICQEDEIENASAFKKPAPDGLRRPSPSSTSAVFGAFHGLSACAQMVLLLAGLSLASVAVVKIVDALLDKIHD